jgi:hypothetical protein
VKPVATEVLLAEVSRLIESSVALQDSNLGIKAFKHLFPLSEDAQSPDG